MGDPGVLIALDIWAKKIAERKTEAREEIESGNYAKRKMMEEIWREVRGESSSDGDNNHSDGEIEEGGQRFSKLDLHDGEERDERGFRINKKRIPHLLDVAKYPSELDESVSSAASSVPSCFKLHFSDFEDSSNERSQSQEDDSSSSKSSSSSRRSSSPPPLVPTDNPNVERRLSRRQPKKSKRFTRMKTFQIKHRDVRKVSALLTATGTDPLARSYLAGILKDLRRRRSLNQISSPSAATQRRDAAMLVQQKEHGRLSILQHGEFFNSPLYYDCSHDHTCTVTHTNKVTSTFVFYFLFSEFVTQDIEP